MLKVNNLCKKYPTFCLDNVSFELTKGCILGFIGVNGAGKTTTLKCILNLVEADSGEIEILGKKIPEDETIIKSEVGFALGEANYYPRTKVKKIAKTYKSFFENWDDSIYESYLKKFDIDDNKLVSQLSTGMRVKLALTFALSHNAKLLIFDEPTSGLDPVAREELQDLFREIVSDGEHSIIFSTHITSDLDRCADFILFIKDGKILSFSKKEDLIKNHLLVCGKKEQLTDSLKEKLIGYKENPFGFQGLIKRESYDEKDNLEQLTPNIEDIMVYYVKEAKE